MVDENPPERPDDHPAPAPSPGPPPEPLGVEMPFLDHLEELRWRLLKSLGAIIVGAILCFAFSDELMKALTYPYEEAVLSLESEQLPGPLAAVEQLLRGWMGESAPRPSAPAETAPPALPMGRRLQALKPMTYFMISLQIALFGGIVLALPVVFYQLWQFIAPGLLSREKRVLVPVVLASVFCFALGALIAYWLVLPLGLRFFLALEPPDMTSQWAVDEYISFVLYLVLGFGIVFELPVLAFFLSRIGLVTPELLRRFRRYAIVAIFIIAAILTPPDPISQICMALPLLVLYEVSIWVSRVSARKDKKKEGEAPEGK